MIHILGGVACLDFFRSSGTGSVPLAGAPTGNQKHKNKRCAVAGMRTATLRRSASFYGCIFSLIHLPAFPSLTWHPPLVMLAGTLFLFTSPPVRG